MHLSYHPEHRVFVFHTTYDERHIPKGAGFTWNRPVTGKWATRELHIARKAAQYADESARSMLEAAERAKRVATEANRQQVIRETESASKGKYVLRPYQAEASAAGVAFFQDKTRKGNALVVCPTGSGKSLILADIADKLNEPVLIFQPSKEILEQNYRKYISYGRKAGIYSASVGVKRLAGVTFAMIGSVIRKMDMLAGFPNIIVDECHLCNARSGMYKELFDFLSTSKVCGLSATPYRLTTDGFGGSILKFLTRTRPRIFKDVIYYVQNEDLFNAGYLAKLKYTRGMEFNRKQLQLNSTGADYTDDSVKHYYRMSNFKGKVAACVNEVMTRRRNALVFTRFVEEAEYLTHHVPRSAIVTAKTPKQERDRIIRAFRKGDIKVACNCAVLSTGFDFPELETVILARPTLSLALYYQQIGRGIRIHPDKEYTEIVDLCDNYSLFGPIESLRIVEGEHGKWFIENEGRQLTNVYYGREGGVPDYL